MLIDEYKGRLPARRACELLKVSTSAYYEWAKAKPADATNEDASLVGEIEKIALEFPGYGYRRIAVELKRRGWASEPQEGSFPHEAKWPHQEEKEKLHLNHRLFPRA